MVENGGENSVNPPCTTTIPSTLDYLHQNIIDAAYIRKQTKTARAYKRRIYKTLYHYMTQGKERQEMHITNLRPTTDWKNMWNNIHNTITEEQKAT
jgi:hypothetical protein